MSWKKRPEVEASREKQSLIHLAGRKYLNCEVNCKLTLSCELFKVRARFEFWETLSFINFPLVLLMPKFVQTLPVNKGKKNFVAF